MRFVLPIGLLLLLTAAYFAFLAGTPGTDSGDQSMLPGASVPGGDEPGVDVAKPAAKSVAVDDSASCIPMNEFRAGPDGYRLDAWFMSWGAPPIGVTPDPAAAYSWYDDKTLLEMGKAGDAIARHERGRRLVIDALTGVGIPPEDSTIWDIAVDSPDLPLQQNVDSRKLREGRDDLFDAAVLGRTYALIEIAVSFALERQALSASGNEESEALSALTVKSLAFGEAVERLIPALQSGYFQSPLPSESRPAAIRALNDVLERVLDERKQRGVIVQPIDEEIFDSFRICQN